MAYVALACRSRGWLSPWVGSREGYVRFTGWLCVVTGVALLIVCGLAAARGEVAVAAVWFVAGSVLVVWGRWRVRSRAAESHRWSPRPRCGRRLSDQLRAGAGCRWPRCGVSVARSWAAHRLQIPTIAKWVKRASKPNCALIRSRTGSRSSTATAVTRRAMLAVRGIRIVRVRRARRGRLRGRGGRGARRRSARAARGCGRPRSCRSRARARAGARRPARRRRTAPSSTSRRAVDRRSPRSRTASTASSIVAKCSGGVCGASVNGLSLVGGRPWSCWRPSS